MIVDALLSGENNIKYFKQGLITNLYANFTGMNNKKANTNKFKIFKP